MKNTVQMMGTYFLVVESVQLKEKENTSSIG
jgi:hypothetical protein